MSNLTIEERRKRDVLLDEDDELVDEEANNWNLKAVEEEELSNEEEQPNEGRTETKDGVDHSIPSKPQPSESTIAEKPAVVSTQFNLDTIDEGICIVSTPKAQPVPQKPVETPLPEPGLPKATAKEDFLNALATPLSEQQDLLNNEVRRGAANLTFSKRFLAWSVDKTIYVAPVCKMGSPIAIVFEDQEEAGVLVGIWLDHVILPDSLAVLVSVWKKDSEFRMKVTLLHDSVRVRSQLSRIGAILLSLNCIRIPNFSRAKIASSASCRLQTLLST